MQAQSQGVAPAKGMFSSFASIFREEGLSGLYRVNGNFCDYNFVEPSRVPCRAGVSLPSCNGSPAQKAPLPEPHLAIQSCRKQGLLPPNEPNAAGF